MLKITYCLILSPNCKIISFLIFIILLMDINPHANVDGYIGNYPDIDKYII